MNKGNKALGKGLAALLPAKPSAIPSLDVPRLELPVQTSDGLAEIATDSIDPNPVQPRSIFEPDKLDELAQSIRVNGIIQPLIVQRVGERYQLVAGERRWRAAQRAGLTHVPAVIRDFAPGRLLELALVENIQREDLNPIEVAQALDRLAREHKLSHEEIGERTGKDRSTVTNLLRLLRLPGDIQVLVAEHRLSMGHARAILGLPTSELQQQVAQRTVSEGLSVRQVERLTQSLTAKRVQPAESGERTGRKEVDPNVAAATRELEAVLGTRVRIVSHSSERGRIEIEYYSAEDLSRIYELIVGERR